MGSGEAYAFRVIGGSPISTMYEFLRFWTCDSSMKVLLLRFFRNPAPGLLDLGTKVRDASRRGRRWQRVTIKDSGWPRRIFATKSGPSLLLCTKELRIGNGNLAV